MLLLHSTPSGDSGIFFSLYGYVALECNPISPCAKSRFLGIQLFGAIEGSIPNFPMPTGVLLLWSYSYRVLPFSYVYLKRNTSCVDCTIMSTFAYKLFDNMIVCLRLINFEAVFSFGLIMSSLAFVSCLQTDVNFERFHWLYEWVIFRLNFASFRIGHFYCHALVLFSEGSHMIGAFHWWEQTFRGIYLNGFFPTCFGTGCMLYAYLSWP